MPSTTPYHPDIDHDLARRLAAVAGRLTSGHDGERLAACAAIERLLAPRGLRLGELIEGLATSRAEAARSPATDAGARELLRRIDASPWVPGRWESQFLSSLRRWGGRMTGKQRAKLAEIAVRAGVR
jgi:hypothetical protein